MYVVVVVVAHSVSQRVNILFVTFMLIMHVDMQNCVTVPSLIILERFASALTSSLSFPPSLSFLLSLRTVARQLILGLQWFVAIDCDAVDLALIDTLDKLCICSLIIMKFNLYPENNLGMLFVIVFWAFCREN